MQVNTEKGFRTVFRWVWLASALVLLAACASNRAGGKQVQPEFGDPERGWQALQDYGCGYCHIIPDVPNAEGTVGPPLTDWAEQSYIAGTLTNTPAAVRDWIRAPQEFEPNTAMPDLGVTEEDARNMSAYLFTLRPTGPIQSIFTSLKRNFLYRDTAPRPVTSGLSPDNADDLAASNETALIREGDEIYARYCAECHRWDGNGIRGSVPALSGNPVVTAADPSMLLGSILQGHRGMLDIDYENRLSERDLAAVISYIRASWWNNAPALTPEEIGAKE